MLVRDGHGRLAVEGRAPREQLEGHDPNRVEVGAGIGRLAQELLGREVVGGPRYRPRLGGARVRERVRQPEVGHLGHAVPGDEHVLGLHIAVNDALSVCMLEGREHLQQDVRDLGRGKQALGGEDVAKALAPNELHDHEVHAVHSPPVVHRDDVRLTKPRGGPGLPAEPVDEARIRGQIGVEDLDGHLPRQDGVVGPEDLAHPPRGDPLQDLVPTVERG
jgi:hypothetical protein